MIRLPRSGCRILDDLHLLPVYSARFLAFGPPDKSLAAETFRSIHVLFAREGSEVVSGLAVIVIAFATMLVNFEFDGKPLLIYEDDSKGA